MIMNTCGWQEYVGALSHQLHFSLHTLPLSRFFASPSSQYTIAHIHTNTRHKKKTHAQQHIQDAVPILFLERCSAVKGRTHALQDCD